MVLLSSAALQIMAAIVMRWPSHGSDEQRSGGEVSILPLLPVAERG